MKTRKSLWFDIGFIDHLGQKNSLFVRHCKNPRLTREHKHLMGRLDRREVHGVYYEPFVPCEDEEFELPMKAYNY